MKKIALFCVVLWLTSSTFVFADKDMYPTISSWVQQFDTLPKNRDGAQIDTDSGFWRCGEKLQQWQEFERVLEVWLQMMATGSLAKSTHWKIANTDQVKPQEDFFDIDQQPTFTPFAHKVIAQPGDQFYIRGDLHGDIFSLLKQLQTLQKDGVINDHFKIIKDNVRIVFLGDYVDRGMYGCEVLYTMMRLALANPDRVIYTRGNHEDVRISSKYGFAKEVDAKFDDPEGDKHRFISRMNDFFPVVLYLGCADKKGIVNYLQCCHGGIEIGYQPAVFLDNYDTAYQLLGALHRETFVKKLQNHVVSYDQDLVDITTRMHDNVILKSPTNQEMLGLMWNDFDVHNEHQLLYNVKRGGGFIYGKLCTEDILMLQSSNHSKIRGILRAHQHESSLNDMMKGLIESNGIYKLWHSYEKGVIRYLDKGLVWTFNVGPDTGYGAGVGFDFDTYAKLTVEQSYDQWSMEVFNTQVM